MRRARHTLKATLKARTTYPAVCQAPLAESMVRLSAVAAVAAASLSVVSAFTPAAPLALTSARAAVLATPCASSKLAVHRRARAAAPALRMQTGPREYAPDFQLRTLRVPAASCGGAGAAWKFSIAQGFSTFGESGSGGGWASASVLYSAKLRFQATNWWKVALRVRELGAGRN